MSSTGSETETETNDKGFRRKSHGDVEETSGNEKHENRSRKHVSGKHKNKPRSRRDKRSGSPNPRGGSRNPKRSRSSSPYTSKTRSSKEMMERPGICHCLGVFGLSSYTEERDLKEVFTQYGPIDDIFIIYDRQSGRSKGFGFVYFKSTEDAIEARKGCQGLNLDGRPIRVDYSLTTHPHAPTPGRYMGRQNSYSRRDDYYDHSDYGQSRCERSYTSRSYKRETDYVDRETYHYREPEESRHRAPKYSSYSRQY